VYDRLNNDWNTWQLSPISIEPLQLYRNGRTGFSFLVSIISSFSSFQSDLKKIITNSDDFSTKISFKKMRSLEIAESFKTNCFVIKKSHISTKPIKVSESGFLYSISHLYLHQNIVPSNQNKALLKSPLNTFIHEVKICATL
jgi:hypothetical protein